MRKLFGNSNQQLQAAIVAPEGFILKHYSGEDLDPIEVAADYYELKGVDGFGEEEDDLELLTFDPQTITKDLEVFTRLQTLAKENDVKDMVPTLQTLKNYVEDISICSNGEKMPSAKPMAEFLFEVFAQVEAKINMLLKGNLVTWYRWKDKIMDYVHTATILTRKYLHMQAKKHPRPDGGFAKTEQAFFDASYDIYQQVGKLLRVTPEPKSSIATEWKGKDLDQFRSKPEWIKAVEALEKVSQDEAHCRDFINENPQAKSKVSKGTSRTATNPKAQTTHR